MNDLKTFISSHRKMDAAVMECLLKIVDAIETGSGTPGPQGEVGPAGPAGAEGPQGPAGPAAAEEPSDEITSA